MASQENPKAGMWLAPLSRVTTVRAMKNHLLPASIYLLLATGPLFSADWPQWRGPQRNDISPDATTAKVWPKDGPKQVWVFKNAGLGYSGFSIVGKQLFTMGARDQKEHVVCLDIAKGQELWATPVGPVYGNQWGDGPRSTPTIDGDRAYALSGTGILSCLGTRDGKIVWQVDLVKDLGGDLQGWGYTESVLVDGDRVICTPGGKKGTMAALDKKSGKVVWQSSELKFPAQYSSCLAVEHGGQRQYVQLLMTKVVGVAAEDGKALWQTSFPGSTAVIPTPIYRDGHIYVTAGYRAGCQLIKLGSSGAEVVYEQKVISNHHGGVVLSGGKVYGHSDSGGWTCQDFLTGAIAWQSNALGKGCCTFVAGHLVCLEESSGTVALVEASPEAWKEKSRFKLSPQTTQRSKRGAIWTHPVVLDGRLYLRDQEFLHCYDVK
jgi:outer membrane protein assembly factor BamB